MYKMYCIVIRGPNNSNSDVHSGHKFNISVMKLSNMIY